MFIAPKAVMNLYIDHLKIGYRQVYSQTNPQYADLIGWVAQTVVTQIANSNAAYHDVEHTLLVALAGQAILQGKQQQDGNVSSQDWLNLMVSLLCHDIGYVQGACNQDQPEKRICVTGKAGDKIQLPAHSTDAFLTPYHVDRSQVFVQEAFAHCPEIEIEAVQHNIELTRFPVPNDEAHQDTINYPGLVRAADLIGQLADPYYLDKLPALFQEFAENGTNKVLGYKHPKDLRASYPGFFWNVVYSYIEPSLSYLELTQAGKQILTNLFANVFIVERELQVAKAQDLVTIR
ncbi:MAG: Npun_R2479 family HD domain-containing metalloprotein [Spirulinaceae cyanobacterium]